jgi:hypothetical protein
MITRKGYNIPEGANCAKYYDRGWPFVESCLSSLVKKYDKVYHNYYEVEFGQDRELSSSKTVLPPLIPEQMKYQLETKTFSNGKVDRPRVYRLYTQAFLKWYTGRTLLDFSDCAWKDDEIMKMSQVIQAGYLQDLRRIDSKSNTR